MIPVLILALAACASAKSLDQCVVGEWAAWSPCKSSRQCSSSPVYSYPLEATSEWDEGRDAMSRLMRTKLEHSKARNECMAAGTCPELLMKPLWGAFECESGMAGDMPCKNIDQLAYLTKEQLGYGTRLPGDNDYVANDVWGWTDPETGDEYAIQGLTGGTSFVRVTDPVNPVPLAFVYTQTNPSLWRDIKVIKNHAYIVSEARNHGLQVFDLRRLRNMQGPLQYVTPDATNTVDFGNAHNIVANEDTDYVYVVGATQTGGTFRTCRGGLLVLDVSNPLNPTYAGCFGTDGYTHDAQCVVYHGPDARYYNREVCFAYNENSLTIVDVHDKNNMVMIAKSAYVNVAYTHQGWATEDHEMLALDDELDEMGKPENEQFTKTYFWDVRDLQTPTLRSIFYSSERSVDHNQYIVGDYVFQSNYESGLRILHLDRANYGATNVGYFDVLPGRTTPQFTGTWSTYAFFNSDTVLVSSMDYGMFIVKPDWEKIETLVQRKTDYAEQTRTRNVLYTPRGATCPALVETRSCDSPSRC